MCGTDTLKSDAPCPTDRGSRGALAGAYRTDQEALRRRASLASAANQSFLGSVFPKSVQNGVSSDTCVRNLCFCFCNSLASSLNLN